jgi:hypothetical protein
MKFRVYVPIVLTLILVTLDSRTPAQSKSPIIAKLIEAKGTVTLERNDSSPRSARKGEPLYLGDLLIAEDGTEAVIQCTVDGSTWPLPDNGLPWGVANTCSSGAEKGW